MLGYLSHKFMIFFLIHFSECFFSVKPFSATVPFYQKFLLIENIFELKILCNEIIVGDFLQFYVCWLQQRISQPFLQLYLYFALLKYFYDCMFVIKSQMKVISKMQNLVYSEIFSYSSSVLTASNGGEIFHLLPPPIYFLCSLSQL